MLMTNRAKEIALTIKTRTPEKSGNNGAYRGNQRLAHAMEEG